MTSGMTSGSAGGPGGVVVRCREEADLDACARVLGEVHEGDGYPVNRPDEPVAWLSPSSLLAAWVAELDGRVAGHVVLSRGGPGDLAPGLWRARQDASGAATAVVSRLFVARAARGHGLGALLLTRAAEEAERRELHPVLDVVATDRAAAALYERQGWHLLATSEQRWGPDRTVTVHSYAAPR
ncbi:GNAT family N-acetyltransferase [Streptomyces sp. CWNU-52B]|uniref:GNAT family N-acetyltransferase n=1 Tax=unclassified Streptomyces TaxID=2593676 RepID=UPI0039BFCF48